MFLVPYHQGNTRRYSNHQITQRQLQWAIFKPRHAFTPARNGRLWHLDDYRILSSRCHSHRIRSQALSGPLRLQRPSAARPTHASPFTSVGTYSTCSQYCQHSPQACFHVLPWGSNTASIPGARSSFLSGSLALRTQVALDHVP